MPEELSFAQRYAQGKTPWDSGQPSAELLRVLDAGKVTGKTALEIGCGTGTNALELARRGLEVTALDYVEQAIQAARKKANHANLKIDFRASHLLKADLSHPNDSS